MLKTGRKSFKSTEQSGQSNSQIQIKLISFGKGLHMYFIKNKTITIECKADQTYRASISSYLVQRVDKPTGFTSLALLDDHQK